MRRDIATSVGTVEVHDEGNGPVVVFVHGVVMDHTLFDDVVAKLGSGVRCVRPVLPLGGHRRPVRPDADVSLHGQARLIAEILDALDVEDAVLVGSDWGGPLLTLADHAESVAGAVLLPMEAFDNIPPGIPGAFAAALAALPGGFWIAAQTMRVPASSRAPFVHGMMTERPVPSSVLRSWARGLQTERGVRRDVRRYVRTSDMDGLVDGAPRLSSFDGPVEILWSPEDRVMPFVHAERLTALLPDAVLTSISDARTLLSLDRPDDVVGAIRRVLQRVQDTPAELPAS